jgi:putative ABC transport system substrate-binding protein
METRKNPYQSLWIIALLLISFVLNSCKQDQDKILIGYVQITPDPILDIAKENLFKALRDSGYIDGKNIRILDNNAQGDLSMIPTILQSLIAQRVDVIVTNSTPCMMAAAQIVKDIPVVFTVSFGPEQIGLKEPPDNLYGVYDSLKTNETVDILQKCIPDLKRIGLPSNNSEPNSVYSAGVFSDRFKKRGIEVVSTAVNSTNDIVLAGEALCQKNIDAIIVAADNTIYLGLNALTAVANKANIPVFVTDPMHANKGAVIGFGVNYKKWGYNSGLKVVDLLKERVGDQQKISIIDDYSLVINKKACDLLGLTIPQEIIAKSDTIIE